MTKTNRTRLAFAVTLSALLAAAPRAFAAGGPTAPEAVAGEGTAPPPASGVRFELDAGYTVLQSMRVTSQGSSDEIARGGPTFGFVVDGRAGALVAGVHGDATLTLNQNEYFAGAHGGAVFRRGAKELAVVPEVGAHHVTGIGGGILISSDAPDVTLPYAGLKVGLLGLRGPGRANLGLWAFARADLGSTLVIAHQRVFTDQHDLQYKVGGFAGGLAFRLAFGG
jgi:hypothetical protein